MLTISSFPEELSKDPSESESTNQTLLSFVTRENFKTEYSFLSNFKTSNCAVLVGISHAHLLNIIQGRVTPGKRIDRNIKNLIKRLKAEVKEIAINGGLD